MDYFELIKNRRSVRGYKADEVEPEKLDKLLEAARLAPTAANRQAFRLVVLKTKGREEKLKKVYPKDWFTQAPLVLCVCAVRGSGWVRSKDSKDFFDIDAAIVMDHIILAATALGLGTCWIGAFDADEAKKLIGLEDFIEPVLLTPLGYGLEAAVREKVRKPLGELVIYK